MRGSNIQAINYHIKYNKFHGGKMSTKSTYSAISTILRLTACIYIATLYIGETNYANASGLLPDSAKPGAIQPQTRSLQIPSKETPKVVIPPLIERPLGIEDGEKIEVRKFIIDGAQDHPALNLYISEAEALVEAEIKRNPEGLTIGQLQVAADQITNYYRQKGFIIATSFIPEQTVVDGIVTISVLEGILGKVVVEGNSNYSESRIKKPFIDLIGKPLLKDSIERSLLTLMDYPGLSVTGLFSPGTEIGTADLTIKVDDEDLFSGKLSLTNYGSEYVGEYQTRADFTFNNITRAADSLTLSLLQSFHPDLMRFGSLSYTRPLSNNYAIGIEASFNDFSIGEEFKALDIEGNSAYESAYIERVFLKNRTTNLKSELRLSGKQSESKSGSGTLSEDKLTVASASLVGDRVWGFGQGGISVFNLRYSHGIGNFLGSMDSTNDSLSSRQGGSGEYAGAEFQKIEADYSHLQKLSKNTFALLRLQGQWSDDTLVSLEQFSIGGPESVRAYSPSEFLMDSGYFSSLELFFKFPELAKNSHFFGKPLGEILQFSIFVDNAGGSLNDPLIIDDENINLTGAGAGVRFDFSEQLSASLTVATSLSSQEPENGRDPQAYFHMEYSF
jgi:hemolysin activation/secretion protein